MNALISAFESLNKWMARLGGAILMMAAVITFYDVSCRFLLNKPTDWALEIAQYSLLFGTMLGGAYAFRDDLYIRVDVITNLFPKAGQARFKLLGYAISFVSFAVLAWYSGKYTHFCFLKGWSQNTPLKTPMWLPLIIIPIGSIAMALQNLLLILKDIRKSS